MNQKKILHVIRHDKGGSAVVVDLITKNLNRKKYEAIIYLEKPNRLIPKRTLLKSIINKKTKNGIKYETTRQKGNKRVDINLGEKIECAFGKRAVKFYFSIKSAYGFITKQAPKINKYIKIIRNNKISLVHTHSELIHGKPEILAAKIVGIPCICHIHAYYKPNHFDKFFKRFVNSFICISNDVAKIYNRNDCIEKKTIIIHNGIDITPYNYNFDNEHIRKELGVKSEDILVCLVGRIVSWKGHEYFIKAIADIANKFPELKGIIVGGIHDDYFGLKRAYFNKLKFIIKELNLKEKIVFTGFRKDVPRILSAMDIVVHASTNPEPFGLVIIEGMASGKPVIATKAGGVLDIIEDGVNGIIVKCKDAKAIANAIYQLVSDKEKSIKIGLGGQKKVYKNFRIEKQIIAIQKLYDNILSSYTTKDSK